MSVSQEPSTEPDAAAEENRLSAGTGSHAWVEVGERRKFPKRVWDFIRRKALLLVALGALGAACGVLTVEQIEPSYVAESRIVLAEDLTMNAAILERAASPDLVGDVLGTLSVADHNFHDPRYAPPRTTPLDEVRVWLGLPRPESIWPLSRWLGDEKTDPAAALRISFSTDR